MRINENEMPFRLRISKFRHVFGTPFRDHDCYRNISITRNAHDGTFCAVNSKFLAIVTETSGGGSFLVLLLSETGRIDVDHPRITGHRGPVVDLKFNPFNDNEIASCSDDGTIKVWSLPDEGLKVDTYQWKIDLHGHQRRVDYVEWHPTAENILLSAGLDHQIILWNLQRAEPIQVYRCHADAIQSITWNRNGTLFATTCKDKHIRVIEARTGRLVSKGLAHPGPKTSKVVFLGDTNRLLSTGYGKQFERQVAIWNADDLSKALTVETIDFSAGALIPYYDHDTRIVFLAGKGDGNIRYYELTEQTEPYLHFLSEYKSSTPQRCLGVMPKLAVDVKRNEIMRFYKLYATGSICEPISMIVPRKSETFQVDIYPETPGPYAALTADDWISGIDRDPILVSMNDRLEGTNTPKITTYKTIDSNSTPNHRCSSAHRQNLLPVAEVAPLPKNELPRENSSLELDLTPKFVEIPPMLKKIESIKFGTSPKEFHDIRSRRASSVSMRKISLIPRSLTVSNWFPKENDEAKLSSSELSDIEARKVREKTRRSLVPSIENLPKAFQTANFSLKENSKFVSMISIDVQRSSSRIVPREKFENHRNSTSDNRRSIEIKKNVWTVESKRNSIFSETNGIDYQQEFFKKQEEIESLRELLISKDDRIRFLEEQLNVFKEQFDLSQLKTVA